MMERKDELKEIMYELLFDAFETAGNNAEIEIKSKMAEDNFCNIDKESAVDILYHKCVFEVKTSDFILNSAIRTYKSIVINKEICTMPDENYTDETYIDFLATCITPFYYEDNEDELESEDYREQPDAAKYELWEDILFDDFLHTFTAFEIIKKLNELPKKKTNSQPTFADYLHHPNKEALMVKLHELLNGKKGKNVATIIKAMIELNFILKMEYKPRLYEAMRREFGNIGTDQSIDNYLLPKDAIQQDHLNSVIEILKTVGK